MNKKTESTVMGEPVTYRVTMMVHIEVTISSDGITAPSAAEWVAEDALTKEAKLPQGCKIRSVFPVSAISIRQHNRTWSFEMSDRENESIYDAQPRGEVYHELCDGPECPKCREWRDGGTDRATPECNCGEPECGNCAAQARALTRRSLEAEARANTEWAARMIAMDKEFVKSWVKTR